MGEVAKIRRKVGAVLAVAMAVPAWGQPVTQSRELFVVDPLEDLRGAADGTDAKLRPELYAAVRRDRRFVGLTREGRVVVAFESHELKLSRHEREGFLFKLSGDPLIGRFDELRELAVRHDPDWHPRVDDKVAGFPITSVSAGAPFAVVELPPRFKPADVRAVAADGRIREVGINSVVRLATDEEVARQWGLKSINAPIAWKILGTKSSAVVAVIDTGIDLTSPDLGQEDLWTGPDGEHGHAFVGGDGIKDVYGHGTHVTGIIAAQGDNGEDIAGVLWNVPLMIVKAFERHHTDCDTVAKAIRWAVEHDANIINASWGTTTSCPNLESAVREAEKKGVLIVAAAGNEGRNLDDPDGRYKLYPACYQNDNIISVLMVRNDDVIHVDSNRGPSSVDLGAPGVNIKSVEVKGVLVDESGTSMAAAHVTGAAAMLWDHPEHGGSPGAVKKALMEHGRKPADPLPCVSLRTLDLKFVKDGSGTAFRSTGRLEYPSVGLGGETAGIRLITPEGSFELELGDDARLRAFVEAHAGREVTASGTLFMRLGFAKRERQVVRVEQLSPARRE